MRCLLLACCVLTLAGVEPTIERIAFCSCVDQETADPLPIGVLVADPQIFIFAGDNVYADGVDMALKRDAYAKLGALPVFRQVRERCTVLATWDDHDYGLNDAGGEYPRRAESQQVFVDFWKTPADSPRRTRPGIHDAPCFGPEDRRVQVILLDTRFFRTPLATAADPAASLLGDEQWHWLGGELAKPARVRVIVSSIQFATTQGGETWAAFPHERRRLLALIARTRAAGVVFVSGDRHFAELSRLTGEAPYPLYDLTSSSVSRPPVVKKERVNDNRIGALHYENNVGMLAIDWQDDPVLTFMVRAVAGGDVLIEHRVALSALQPR